MNNTNNFSVFSNQQVNFEMKKLLALNEKSPKLNLSVNPFNIKLKPHQEALLYKVLDVDEKISYSSVPYAVMSDKPGSGKTYVVLALIYFAIKRLGSKGANIIVVPHNIYSQWITSIEKLLGNKLTYKLLLEYSEINLLFSNPNMLYQYDIILTTSLYYDVFASTVQSIGLNVRRVFFDEADTIKNLLAHSMPCAMTWFISASIDRVFDHKSNTAKIGSYNLSLSQLLVNDCFCNPEFIDSNIKLPKPNFEIFKCKDYYLDNMLSNFLQREQLAFINGHDYSNIRIACGGVQIRDTKDIVENLYKNSMKIIRDLNSQIKEIEKKVKYVYTQEEKNKYAETKAKLEFERQTHLILTNKIKQLGIELMLCGFCFKKINSKLNINSFKMDYFNTECGLYMCNQCYQSEISNAQITNENVDIQKIKIKCLDCESGHLVSELKFHTGDLISINEKNLDLENINKLLMLEKILEIVGKKTIIFSQYKGISHHIQSIVNKSNLQYLQLDGGNIKDLDNILLKFKNDSKVKILLIDDSSFGVGLNIEYTTDMIFFNYVIPSIKTQLIGRAQRLGRTCKLNVWELLYKNEIE